MMNVLMAEPMAEISVSTTCLWTSVALDCPKTISVAIGTLLRNASGVVRGESLIASAFDVGVVL